MVTKELLDFIQKQLGAGMSKEELAKTLESGGWARADVDEALRTLTAPAAPSPAQVPKASLASRSTLMLVSIVALLLIGGTGVYAYVAYFAPNLSARALFDKSLVTALAASSYTYAATSTVELRGRSLSGSLTTSVVGAVDKHDTTNPLGTGTISVVGSAQSTTTNGSVDLSLEGRVIGHKLYGKLDTFSLLLSSTDPKDIGATFFAAFATSLAKPFENRWIIFDLASSSLASSTPYSSYASANVSPADKAALRAYVQGETYVQSVTDVGSETLSGVSTRHLHVAIQNTQALVDLLNKSESDIASSGKNSSAVSATAQQQADLDAALLQPIALDEWVSNDGHIHKLSLAPVAFHDTKSGSTATITVEATCDNYDKPVSIEVPQGAEDIESIAKQLFGGFGSSKTQTLSR